MTITRCLLLTMLLQACALCQTLTPGDHRRTMYVDGAWRVYRVHIPPSYDPATPMPLVLGLHSANHRGFHMADAEKGISRKADAIGFVAVYPNSEHQGNGQGYGWNWQDDPRMLDDLAFLEKLIDRMIDKLAIDEDRIYCLGVSSGGFMTQKLGSVLSHRIAAIAPVSASLGFWPQGGTQIVEIPPPSTPLPVLMLNGKRDQLIPYDGSQYVISVAETIDFWVEQNQCDPIPQQTYESDYDATLELYSGGVDGSEVGLCTFHSKGHAWQIKDDDPRYPHSNIDLIWRFFERHRLRADPLP